MSASLRYVPERIVVVTVSKTGEKWTNETGERVFVDSLELVLPGDDYPTIVVEHRRYLEAGETLELRLDVTDHGRAAAS